jgi:T5SS/PEP-CTERM-associated repeat protein
MKCRRGREEGCSDLPGMLCSRHGNRNGRKADGVVDGDSVRMSVRLDGSWKQFNKRVTEMHRGRRARIHNQAILALLLICGLVSNSHGADIRWVGSGGCGGSGSPLAASWFNEANWYGYVMPGPGDLAWLGSGFDPGAPGDPTYIYFGGFCSGNFPCPEPVYTPGGDATIDILRISDGAYTFDFETGSYGVCSPPSDPLQGSLTCLYGTDIGMTVSDSGQPGDASLTIRNGSFTTGNLCLARQPGATGRLLLDGPTASLTTTSVGAPIWVGLDGQGYLDVHGGADVLLHGWLTIGVNSGSNGFVTVMGPGSTLQVDNAIRVCTRGPGYDGSRGALSISDGGSVACGGAIEVGIAPAGHDGLYIENGSLTTSWGVVNGGGRAVVTGPAATWTNTTERIHVGEWTSGALEVRSGATVRANWVDVGSPILPGESGALAVVGSGSVVNADFTSGNGQVLLSEGGRLVGSGGGGYVGVGDDATVAVTIDGPGSAWTGMGMLAVGGWAFGENGVGSVVIRGGGEVSAAWVDLGLGTLGHGSISVEGEGSSFAVDGNFLMGAGPSGFSASSGAQVACATASIGATGTAASPEASAILTGAGTLWTCQEQLLIGEQCPGVLSVSQGARVIAHPLVVGPYGRLAGDGTVEGDVVNNQMISPGNSPGLLNIAGDYTQGTDGTLLIEVAGSAPESGYDVLHVTGQASLAGRLEVRFIDGFLPAAGSQFNVLLADSVTGAFADVVSSDGMISAEYLAGQVRVTVLNTTGVPEQDPSPSTFALRVMGSNPVRSSSGLNWSCDLPAPMQLTVRLYDIAGREVALPRTVSGGPGTCSGRISAEDIRKLPTGVYLLSAQAAEFRDTRRVMIVR